MDVLKKLNASGSFETTPFKKLNELEIDREYQVNEVKQISTKNGEKIIVELMDEEWKDFTVFLPERCNNKKFGLTEIEIKHLNKFSELKFLHKGTKECGKGNEANLFEFRL
ncbi:hypothetical protein TNCV_3067111 [Trichonephila clavipes]|nr:hypothetical protein TNCV_3067111 [Trichonephila clavipes]